MRCATHPQVETDLRCGKCQKPICPKCLVHTPVGARCPDCAGLHRLPTYQVSTSYYLRAIGTGLGTAIACGFVWWAIDRWIPLNLSLILAPVIGYAISEAISRSVNRKRGTGLAIIAGSAMIVSYLVSIFTGNILFQHTLPFIPVNVLHLVLDLVALALGISVAATRSH